MKAISLWRPWPWAFFHAGKRVENRSWKLPSALLGEWIAMHAAQRFDDKAALLMVGGAFGDPARGVSTSERDHATGIVGAFRITSVFQMAGVLTINGKHIRLGRGADPFEIGPWCWVVHDLVQLPEPIPCKGRQGLWTVPADIAARIQPHLRAA